MGKLPNPHLATFRQSPIISLPATWPRGWSKGDEGYQMIALEHGSHIVSLSLVTLRYASKCLTFSQLELDQAEVMQRVVGRIGRGERVLEAL